MTRLAEFLRRRRAAFRLATLLAASAAAVLPAQAQFSLAVSPPRFELSAKPAERVREVLELTHSDVRAGAYKLKTADWTLRPDGSVDFSDELLPGSCRPWVAIERRELSITPGRPYRFRFEVAPPADTPAVECRFAVMIEGQQPAAAPGMPIALGARIGVIVYVAVGDVAPVLELAGTAVKTIDGRPTPVLKVRNTGNAHGRLAGFLGGKDADGTALEVQAATTPIMAGETREIALVATKPGDTETAVAIRYPLSVSGKLEWGRKGSMAVEQRFAP
ncbi:hypothetical protein C7T35_26865 [Variovorax sp. WS11]|uniref:hypothetical protein n=1 Tax=Variovorax sp. WS11 TaxID=1105204 RepID=UPI000D0CE07C|nr:hypothetical protein [Variovorax sp. WS11]NDZ14413.1 hypothetical protein [Variovorax sp. WS11]PSL81506.1 hypothetical protein C7T35_26865 [Variovorax sp. WS11]